MKLSKFSVQKMLSDEQYLQIPPDKFIFRRMMEYGIDEIGVARAFRRCTKSIDKRSRPLWIGYKAMSSFLMSIHESENSGKMRYFNEGKLLLEYAIHKEPQNAELRLIRLFAQRNLRHEIDYSKDMVEDQNFLNEFCEKKLTSSFDKELQLLIGKFETVENFKKNLLA